MNEPKILVWDIETAHALAAIFSLYQQGTPPQNIKQEWYIICAAWKWLGEKRVYGVSVLDDKERFEKSPHDDYHVVKTVYEVIKEADAIVHHYGDNFDIKKFNTRLIAYGFDPLPDIPQIDTYKICKAKFKFMSNKLDYVSKYLGFGGKMETSTGLWLKCLLGVKSAVREMLTYNKQDVEVLEKVYQRLAPYSPVSQRKLNMNLWYGDNNVCPTCGSGKLHRRGYRRTRLSSFARFQCQECGSWSSAPLRKDDSLGALR